MTTIELMRNRLGLLTVPEAAELMGIHKITLYRAIQDGELEVLEFGPNRLRIQPSAFADYWEEHIRMTQRKKRKKPVATNQNKAA